MLHEVVDDSGSSVKIGLLVRGPPRRSSESASAKCRAFASVKCFTASKSCGVYRHQDGRAARTAASPAGGHEPELHAGTRAPPARHACQAKPFLFPGRRSWALLLHMGEVVREIFSVLLRERAQAFDRWMRP